MCLNAQRSTLPSGLSVVQRVNLRGFFKEISETRIFAGRDFICVQSLDGTLSVYEQESFAFTRFLPGALLPAPLAYAPSSDSFVTVSSAWQLESYKYINLAYNIT